ncbi:MAG: branched-chain amino acid ABC transporter permease [Anaerolineaceae bacterium]|nr:branched-chain amino acid ABC transporter permease [Anaerolineaceae bacterium]MDE0329805.1 branched-chain amino acid ABC transporter permease [Anaerolineaceae bacterium]
MSTLAANWRTVIRSGLIAGGVALYTALIGMLVAFDEREVVRNSFTLGQLLLVAPAVLVGWLTGRKSIEVPAVQLLLRGLVAGIVSSLPLLALLLVSSLVNLRTVLINVDKDLVRLISFDHGVGLSGALILASALGAAGILGAFVHLIPARLRHALLTALAWMLGAGILGELVRQLLSQFLDREALSWFLRRDTLKPEPAAVLFAVVLLADLFWSWFRETRGRREGPAPRALQFTRVGGLAVLLLLLPLLVGSAISDVLSNIGLYILMGLGLNIAVGLAGLFDLGYVTNFAVGAYTMGVLTSTGVLGIENKMGVTVFNFWLVLPVSLLVAMFTGFILALPVLRMRGDYLAIATLGFGEIIRLLALSDWLKPIIGGAQGVLFIPAPNFFGVELIGPQRLYYIILGACLLAIFVSSRLNNSRTGRQWMAIREDEDVASAMGINTARSKLLAFTISAATGGVAGAIFAAKLGTIFPTSFNLLVSVNVLSLIIIGGLGSLPGIIVGALFLVGLPELLREFDEFRLLLYGTLMVTMMLARPEGLWPSAVYQREVRRGEERAPPQAGEQAA